MIGHGGLLRAFSFARPIRGSGHVSGKYPQIWPDDRRLEFSLCNLMLKLCGICAAPLSSGRIVPRVTIGKITPSG